MSAGKGRGMTRDELIDELAAVLAGLQVPLSLSAQAGAKVLGAAQDPYLMILGDTPLGWKSKDDFRTYLERVL